jgi:hypothetical protein
MTKPQIKPDPRLFEYLERVEHPHLTQPVEYRGAFGGLPPWCWLLLVAGGLIGIPLALWLGLSR